MRHILTGVFCAAFIGFSSMALAESPAQTGATGNCS
jgi:hypothetical protein